MIPGYVIVALQIMALIVVGSLLAVGITLLDREIYRGTQRRRP